MGFGVGGVGCFIKFPRAIAPRVVFTTTPPTQPRQNFCPAPPIKYPTTRPSTSDLTSEDNLFTGKEPGGNPDGKQTERERRKTGNKVRNNRPGFAAENFSEQ